MHMRIWVYILYVRIQACMYVWMIYHVSFYSHLFFRFLVAISTLLWFLVCCGTTCIVHFYVLINIMYNASFSHKHSMITHSTLHWYLSAIMASQIHFMKNYLHEKTCYQNIRSDFFCIPVGHFREKLYRNHHTFTNTSIAQWHVIRPSCATRKWILTFQPRWQWSANNNWRITNI